MQRVIVIGGGVIGLSLAYELASRRAAVTVLERGDFGREASWAGAGMLPPASGPTDDDPYQELLRLSHGLHAEWAERLRRETGIDNGYCRCGAVYLAENDSQRRQLAARCRAWRQNGVEFQPLDKQQLHHLEPGLNAPGGAPQAVHVPDEGQIRNPRHLKALLAACAGRGVVLEPQTEVTGLQVADSRVAGVQTGAGVRRADVYCVAGGAWSHSLLAELGVETSVRPIRAPIAA